MAKGVRLVIKENIPQPLEEILRKHKVYSLYVERTYYSITIFTNSVLKTRKMNTKEYQRFVRRVARERNDISRAFHWSTTPEGYAFWEKIYDEYIQKLEELR